MTILTEYPAPAEIFVVKLPSVVPTPPIHFSKPTYPVLPATTSWYLLFASTRRKARPALPRLTKFSVKATRWLYHELPAWTDEPAGTFITPPEKVIVPASIVQTSFTLSLKLSASQPILIV